MRTQATIFNDRTVKGNDLKSKSSIYDRDFRKIFRYFFHLIFVGLPFFCFLFLIMKARHEFEFKCPTAKIFVPTV